MTYFTIQDTNLYGTFVVSEVQVQVQVQHVSLSTFSWLDSWDMLGIRDTQNTELETLDIKRDVHDLLYKNV